MLRVREVILKVGCLQHQAFSDVVIPGCVCQPEARLLSASVASSVKWAEQECTCET